MKNPHREDSHPLVYLDEVNPNLRVGKRFDPFIDAPLDLAMLMSKEMCLPELPTPDSREKSMVHQAIELLSESDREIVTRWFFMGQSVWELGEHFQLDVDRMKYRRNKALENLKSLLRKLLFGASDVELHQHCPVCCSPNATSLSEFLHLWWDYNRHSVEDIIPELRKRFGPAIAKAANATLLRQHLQGHLHLGKSVKRDTIGKARGMQNKQTTFTIPADMNKELTGVANKRNWTVNQVLRECCRIGLPILKRQDTNNQKKKG